MSHLNEEELILHYYGEESEALSTEQHLEACGECRETYASLVRVLNVVDSLPVPDRGENYAAQVWSRIEKRIPARRRFDWLIPVAMPYHLGRIVAVDDAGAVVGHRLLIPAVEVGWEQNLVEARAGVHEQVLRQNRIPQCLIDIEHVLFVRRGIDHGDRGVVQQPIRLAVTLA